MNHDTVPVVNLPPLPAESYRDSFASVEDTPLYTADQMEAYARDAVLMHITGRATAKVPRVSRRKIMNRKIKPKGDALAAFAEGE